MAQLRGQERRQYVAGIFGRISRRYDLLNGVMSGGRHHAWRREAVRLVMKERRGPVLDVATGTGDFAVEAARNKDVAEVVGLDLTPPMLRLASKKVAKNGTAPKIQFMVGDAQSLPFPDAMFACATVGFGVRNFPDLPGALQEMKRVLKPGGRLAVLEIVYGRNTGPIATLFRKAFRWVTPWVGLILARDREAYTYLPESVLAFVTGDELADHMALAGFRLVGRRSFAFGSVVILIGEKV
ncbi:MAG: ubiquinone/menaquinone biosynthesis methyltransferase [Chloroflexi bacterium]|nr:ubiquinone/menaquinone biosynthesis methyltransferase [Chloroflexota bacterium]